MVFKKGLLKIRKITVFSFLLCFALCSILISIAVVNRSVVEELQMEQLIMDKSVKINEVITKLLYKTEALSALVVQSNGDVTNFERIASTIVDDPSILNVLIAPDGIVSEVYPLKGNEGVLGLNFFKKGAGNKEAILAKEKKELVFGGPFGLVQGGQALVGRLPVFIGEPNGKETFWGIVSVTLKFPQALEGVGLNILESQGFAYEIWRTNPDNNEKQVILMSESGYSERARYIEKYIPMLNAEWYFKVAPVKNWYNYYETWILIVAGLFVSLLLAFIVQNNAELKNVKKELEDIARLDYLTGIFSRRHFMETSLTFIDEAIEAEEYCFVIILDLDHFKIVNDTYGHIAGDKVLKGVVERIRKVVEKDQKSLLARYGGEEFIILAADKDELAGKNIAESIRKNLAGSSFKIDGIIIQETGSFGIAKVKSSEQFEEAIRYADEALYKAKDEGRNKVVCYEDIS